MSYELETVGFENIKGNTKTNVKRGRKTLCVVTATHKYNQETLAKLISLLGMNVEAKVYILSAIKEKYNNSLRGHDIPKEVVEFVKTFEKLI